MTIQTRPVPSKTIRRPNRWPAVRGAAGPIERLETRALLAAALSGQVYTGTLAAGATASYEFSAVAGQKVIAALAEQTLNRNDSSTPQLQLFSPGNIQLAIDSTFDGLVMVSDELSTSGTYRFVVSDSAANSSLTYRFSLNAGSTALSTTDTQTGPIDSGRYTTATLQAGELNVYTIRSRAGGSLVVHHAEQTPDRNDDSTPAIAVFSPSGALLANEAEFDGQVTVVEDLPEDGTYRIAVYDSAANSAIVTGVTVVAAPTLAQIDDGNNNGTLADGSTRTSITAPGEANVYTFLGEAGTSLTLTLAEITPDRNDARTPAIRLFGPDGSQLGYAADFDATSVSIPSLPLDGQYAVIVSDSNGNSALNYNLSRTGGGSPFAYLNYFDNSATFTATRNNDAMGITVRDAVRNSVAVREMVLSLNNRTNVVFLESDVTMLNAFGGAGNDQFIADASVETPMYITGEDGDDTLLGGSGSDTITSGAGRNRLFGNGGIDRLNGSGGRDFLRGGADADRLYGNGGGDDLAGEGGVDRLFGGDGDDFLKGGSSNDKLYGEAGADTLVGEGQSDLLLGGSGNDFFGAADGSTDTLDGGAGTDSAEKDNIDSVLAIESFV